MAKSKPRRPTIGRGLPPPPRLTPEEEAEEDRIRAWIIVRGNQIEALFKQKAEAREGQRLEALCEAEETADPPPLSRPWP